MSLSQDILRDLVAFPTVSLDSNLELIGYLREFLARRKIDSTLYPSEDGKRANLFATLGPKNERGIMLSGHTDVVPVTGQHWNTDPFAASERNGLVFGRGTADMKGFLASMLAMTDRVEPHRLRVPIHLAFSYDEEIGCVGVRRLIEGLRHAATPPEFCVVGEPTSMQVVVAHKGKAALRATCCGVEAHSSRAPKALNAIYLASDMIEGIRRIQQHIVEHGPRDDAFDIGYTTVHVGTISGGTALNIVPNNCEMTLEVRNIPQQPLDGIVDQIQTLATRLEETARRDFPAAAISLETVAGYPALDTDPANDFVTEIKAVAGRNDHGKIAFGTEGGLFDNELGITTVVCGPGNIAQAHKPDEYIEKSQLQACDQFLSALVTRICQNP